MYLYLFNDSMIQCLMHEHTTHTQSILCFDIMYLQVCSFYYVASLLYINYIAKLRILLRINKFLYIKMKSHTLKYQYFIYFQYPTACYTRYQNRDIISLNATSII